LKELLLPFACTGDIGGKIVKEISTFYSVLCVIKLVGEKI